MAAGQTSSLSESRGGAALNTTQDVFIVDDADGVALYKVSNTERVRTFEVPSSKERRPKNVCFSGDGGTIISGSDHGKAYVFERRTGQMIDEIDTGIKDWVQKLTVSQKLDDLNTSLPTVEQDGRYQWNSGGDLRKIGGFRWKDRASGVGAGKAFRSC